MDTRWMLQWNRIKICSKSHLFLQADFLKGLPVYNKSNFSRFHADSVCKASVSTSWLHQNVICYVIYLFVFVFLFSSRIGDPQCIFQPVNTLLNRVSTNLTAQIQNYWRNYTHFRDNCLVVKVNLILHRCSFFLFILFYLYFTVRSLQITWLNTLKINENTLCSHLQAHL